MSKKRYRDYGKAPKKHVPLPTPAAQVSVAVRVSIEDLEKLSPVQRRAFMCGLGEVIGASGESRKG